MRVARAHLFTLYRDVGAREPKSEEHGHLDARIVRRSELIGPNDPGRRILEFAALPKSERVLITDVVDEQAVRDGQFGHGATWMEPRVAGHVYGTCGPAPTRAQTAFET